MYVIAEIQGQQFKIEQGKKLFVHHIQDVEAGATVEFEKILLADKDGKVTIGTPTVKGAKVVCEVKTALVKGEKVQLIGFGTFEVTERAAREGRNPRTNETITIPAAKAPRFKAGKMLKDMINQ